MKTTDKTTDVRMCIQGKETTLFADAVLPACDWSRIVLVFEALSSACEKHPTWPTDPMHALAVLAEELGELTKEVLQATYEPGKGATLESITQEAAQTAAMALRFFLMLSSYKFQGCKQV